MEFLQKKIGPFSGRMWGLVLNFIANGLAIHGAVRYMIRNESPVEMIVGIVSTVVICMVISVPDKSKD
jgi:hypothetical protein